MASLQSTSITGTLSVSTNTTLTGDLTVNGTQTLGGNLTVGSGTSSYINMVDSDHGNRSIHNNSNRIGFLTHAMGWGAYCDDNGNWTAVGNVTAYSDKRLKTNIEVIPDALDKINSLSGYTFDRIDAPEGLRQTGVIAQEVQEVLPEAIINLPDEGTGEETLSVAYGNMVGLLIEGIKEQQVQIDELKAEIEELKAK